MIVTKLTVIITIIVKCGMGISKDSSTKSAEKRWQRAIRDRNVSALVAATLAQPVGRLQSLLEDKPVWRQLSAETLEQLMLACALADGFESAAALMVAKQMQLGPTWRKVAKRHAADQSSRAKLLHSGSVPKALFQTVDVVDALGLSYNAFAKQYAKQGRPVLVKGWTLQHSEMAAVFTWETLPRHCSQKKAPIWKYSQVKERANGWAGLEHVREMKTDKFIASIRGSRTRKKQTQTKQGFIFNEPLEVYCPSALQNYSVPFMASNSLLHRTNLDTQRMPSLFVQPAGTTSGLHVDSSHSHFVQVQHQGRKHWVLYPFSYEDQATFMSPPQKIIHNGLGTLMWAETKFADRDFWEDEKSLFAQAHKQRVEVDVEAGDLMFVPAGIPHFVNNVEDVIATSINYIDRTNIDGWSTDPEVIQDMGIPAIEHVRKVAKKSPLHDSDVLFSLWNSGVQRDWFKKASAEL